MDGEQDKKIQLDDDALKMLEQKASNLGRSNFEKQKEIFERINGGETKVSHPSESTNHSNAPIKNLRTFQGDVAEAIKNQNLSIGSIALEEQKRKVRRENESDQIQPGEKPFNELARIPGKRHPPGLPEVTYRTPKPPEAVPVAIIKEPRVVVEKKARNPELVRNTLTIVVSAILVLLGIGSLVGFYLLQKKPPTLSTPSPVDQTIISFSNKEIIPIENLGREELIVKINAIKDAQGGSDNQITYIALTKQVDNEAVPVSLTEFLAILKTSIPPATLRSFKNQFMLGMEYNGRNQPFIIIKLSSFDNAFAGMLAWEKTLNSDLGVIFSRRSIPITSNTPTASTDENQSSTTPPTTQPVTRIVNTDANANSNFEDVTIQNKDARVLKNSRGEEVMLYSFLDQNTLLITSGASSFHDILNKYLASQLVR